MNEKLKKILKITLLVFLTLTAIAFWVAVGFSFFEDSILADNCYQGDEVAVIEIKGAIKPYLINDPNEKLEDAVSSEDIVSCISQIKNNDSVKALVLSIDSQGGNPVASEEVMNAIKTLGKPTVSVIRESGLSGAYLIASATDRIFASELSDIGSIGVTMSYLDYSQKDRNDGVIYQELSSAKFKNTGDPDKPLNTEEKALIQRDLKILHEAFVKNISKNRKLDTAKVEKLADGSSMLGQMAKENGLIDEIGNLDSAKAWIDK